MGKLKSGRHQEQAQSLMETPLLIPADWGKKNNINFLRLTLALLVVFFHYYPIALGDYTHEPILRWFAGNDYANIGSLRVMSFFALSGLLVSKSWLGQPRLAVYFQRRLLRIWPGFFVASLATLFIFVPLGTSDRAGFLNSLHSTRLLGTYLLRAIFLQMPEYPFGFEHNPLPCPFAINGSLWTVIYEVSWYGVIAGLGVLGLLTQRRFVLGLFGLILFANWEVQQHYTLWGSPAFAGMTLGWWMIFGTAFVAGMVALAFRDRIQRRPLLAVCAMLSFIPAHFYPSLLLLLIPTSFIYLLFYVMFSDRLKRFLFAPKVDLSYGIYLYAFPVQQLLVCWRPAGWNSITFTLATIGLTIPCALGSWYFIERPAKNYFLRKPAAPVVVRDDSAATLGESGPERDNSLAVVDASRGESFDQLSSFQPMAKADSSEAAAAPPPDGRAKPKRQIIGQLAEPLSLVGLFAFFLWKTWLKWPEPMVDFSRYLYIPWRLSEGALLFRDVSCFYGPLPLLVQAEAFRLFGPGLDVIIWLNIAVTAGIIALLRGIFQTIGSRFSGWLSGVIFIVVFSTSILKYHDAGIFNYITPYSCQATWGLGGVLLTVYALLRHIANGRRRWLFLAGVGVGIAYLDKVELLFTALGALGLYLGLRLVERLRAPNAAGGLKSSIRQFTVWLGWCLAGFLTTYFPVLAYFVRAGGWNYGFSSANWSLRMFVDPSYARATTTYFQYSSLGFDHPWPNFLSHLGWGLVLVGFCVIAVWAERRWRNAQRTGRAEQGFIGLVLGMSFLAVLFTDWLDIGRALLVPTILIVLGAVGWSFWQVWQRRALSNRLLGVAVVAAAAMLMLLRMLLNVRLAGYGFFLAPLALLLVAHGLVYEIPWRFGDKTRPNSLLQVTFTLLVLVGVVQIGRLSLANYADRTYQVGTGRDHFYTYAPEISDQGLVLNIVINIIQQHFNGIKTLTAFQESQAADYHLRKINPLAEMQFHPDILTQVGIDNLVAQLTAHPPDAVVVTARSMPEYGVAYFGSNDFTGKAIIDWVKLNYVTAFYYGESSDSAFGHKIDIFLRRDLVANAGGARQ